MQDMSGLLPTWRADLGDKMTQMVRIIVVCMLAVVIAACNLNSGSKPIDGMVFSGTSTDLIADDASSDAAEVVLPEPTFLWPGENPLPAWPKSLESYPALADLSTWSSHREGTGDVWSFRGYADFAAGNGHVFALLGYGPAVNTLHSMVGPIYHKGEGFFSDATVVIRVGEDGPDQQWSNQWVARQHEAPIVLTHAQGPLVTLTTVDVAPLLGAVDDPIRRAMARLVVVRNPSTNPIANLWLAVTYERLQEAGISGPFERRDDRIRTLVALTDAEQTHDGKELRIALPTIPGQGKHEIVLIFATDNDGAGLTEKTIDRITKTGFAAIVDQTVTAWSEWLSQSTRITTPDTRVNDYLEGQKIVVLSQRGFNGASHPMSQYTRSWLRDNAGPVRFFTKCGLFKEAREQLDYLWLAALVEGSIKNSYPGHYVEEDLPAGNEPDWDSLPVMTGRSRAESPSYLALMYAWYIQASGDFSMLTKRFSMLQFALEKQHFQGDLLYFSTDETFRTAMAVAHDLDLQEQFEEGYYSANSSFLWVAAAEQLATLAKAIGKDDISDSLGARAKAVRLEAEATYGVPGGAYHPYVYGEESTPAPAPFEDVNTKPLWCGYSNADAPEALDNLVATISAIGGEDGILVSSLPESFKNLFGLPITEGLHTGMSPGYFLHNLAVTNHPLAESAFNALAVHATASGTTPEYQILDDHNPLHLIYDSTGATGDYTARYRPWEGAIMADAAYTYLLGIQAFAADNVIKLFPHLPNGWSWLEAGNLRVGEIRFDLRIEFVNDTWKLIVSDLTGGDSVFIHLTIPLATDSPDCTLNGEPYPCSASTGRWLTTSDELVLEITGDTVLEIDNH